MDSSEKILKVYGLERTGTNYIEWLVNRNYPYVRVCTNQMGWKHAAVRAPVERLLRTGLEDLTDEERDDLFAHRFFKEKAYREEIEAHLAEKRICFAIMVKNPYSWYVSMARYHKFPIHPLRKKLFRHWNRTNSRWFQFANEFSDRTMIFRYEDLLCRLDQRVEEMGTKFNLERRNGEVEDQLARIAPSLRVTKKEMDRLYFFRRDYLKEFTQEDMETINPILNPMLMGTFNYTKVRDLNKIPI